MAPWLAVGMVLTVVITWVFFRAEDLAGALPPAWLGGVAATPIRALETEAALEGRPWTDETARAAGAVLRSEGTPIDDHRASAAFRIEMLGQSLPKLHAEVGGPG